MSDTQNTYSSSNLHPFVEWASTKIDGTQTGDLITVPKDSRKRVKSLFTDLPKYLEESNKSYLGLTRR